MGYIPQREAGLPRMVDDTHGYTTRYGFRKGVVKAIYPDLWRVDIETEGGGLLNKALVASPHFPPVDDGEKLPSHVAYSFFGGHVEDAFCIPLTFRRFHGPEVTGKEEREYYNVHLHCERAGDITIRVTNDNRWIIENEDGDYVELKTDTREIRVIAPTVYIGTTEDQRIEFKQDKAITLVANDIRLGTETASQQVIMGNLFMELFNALVSLYNGHQHTGVQPGAGFSSSSTAPANMMDGNYLSDITRAARGF